MNFFKLLILTLLSVQYIITSDFQISQISDDEIAQIIDDKLLNLACNIESYLRKNKFYENLKQLEEDLEFKKKFITELEESLKDLSAYEDLIYYIPINLSLIVDTYLTYIFSSESRSIITSENNNLIIKINGKNLCLIQFRIYMIHKISRELVIFKGMSLSVFLFLSHQCVIL